MAFYSSTYNQPDTFRSRVNDARERSAMAAFNALSSGSPTNAVIQRSFQDDGSSLAPFAQSASLASTGTGWISGMGNALSGLEAQNAATMLSRAGTAASRQEELRTQEQIYKNTKDAIEDQESSGLFGSILSTGLSIAGMFCERRLKTDIAPIDATHAWATVRDLPLYSFRYRHNPAIPAYGPMVDEVRQVDPDLLIPMDEQAQHLAIADGEPIYGVDIAKRAIYESAALQQALQRIEQLEARLAQLEGQVITPAGFLPLHAVTSLAA